MEWDTEEIMLEVATSFDDPTPQTVNLVEGMGARSAEKRKTTNEDWHWLPPELNSNSEEFRTKKVMPFLQKACVPAGFLVMNRGWQDKRSRFSVVCTRGRAHVPTTKNSAKVSTTQRPLRGEEPTCRFL